MTNNAQAISEFASQPKEGASEEEDDEDEEEMEEQEESEDEDMEMNGDDSNGAANRFIQQQHRIIRKYGINGHLSLSDVAFFHNLINNGNYLIISAFEVFALNKDPKDFLENLRLIA